MGNIASKNRKNKRKKNAAIVQHQWNEYTTYTVNYTNKVQLATARNSWTTHGEKRYDLRNHTLRFVDREDEMDCKSNVTRGRQTPSYDCL